MLEAGLVVSRFLHYVASLSLFGAALFPLYIYRGCLAAFRRDEFGPTAWLRRILVMSLVLAVISGAGWFVFAAGTMAGDLSRSIDPAVLSAVMTGTDFGPLWAMRGVLAAIIAVLLLRWPSALSCWLVPLLAAAFLASLGATGHGRAPEGWGGMVHLISDGVHLLAAGWWLGGLWPLGVLASAHRAGDLALGDVLRRFSGVGTMTVALLVASGAVNSLFLVGSPGALLSTRYGELLTAKIVLFLAMALLAGANRFWITPRLDPEAAGATKPWLRRLRHHLLAEQALGLGIFALVSVLGTLQPALAN